MRTTDEARAREHLHRSEATFIAAAVAFSFGLLSMWQTFRLVSGFVGSGGVPPAYVAVWAFSLVGFVAALWATSVISRNTSSPLG